MNKHNRFVKRIDLELAIKFQFFAMGSPCEILFACTQPKNVEQVAHQISDEVYRLEDKYSRYLTGNIVHKINQANGKTIIVDDETAKLFDFAATCYTISDGLFDITSGSLRQCWSFAENNQRHASQKEIDKQLDNIGWHKVRWQKPELTLLPTMEIDFGGIVKEYAVDRCAQIAQQNGNEAFLINLGGDLYASPKQDNSKWFVGIEHPDNTDAAINQLELQQGALATSGDVRRYVEVNGKRYGHILNPKTGWPVQNAPRSVTVHAAKCTDAGILSTLAMLKGADAESFLAEQNVQYWCYR